LVETTGLTAYYKADSDGSFNSSVGSLHGTISGASYNASGKIGGAYEFGSGDYIALGASNSHFTSNTNWSVSMWIKTTTYPLVDSDLVFCFHTASTASYAFYVVTYNSPTGRINGYVKNGSGSAQLIFDVNGYDTTSFYHLVITYDGATVKTYINNTEVGSQATTFNGFGSFQAYLGSYSNSFTATRSYDGLIDEVSTWSRTLSTYDIADLYNSGVGLSYPFSGGEPTSWNGKFNGIAPSKINGIAITSISKVNGI